MKTIINKKLCLLGSLFVLFTASASAEDAAVVVKRKKKANTEQAAPQGPREVVFEVKKIGEAIHWSPERVEVKRGEKIKITAKYELEGGKDFHGFQIAALGINESVLRGKTFSVEKEIPTSLKPGTYPIACGFHPAHVGSNIVVTE